MNDILDSITHHLYVCPMNSEPLERHILMRNFLRKNDWARIKYQNMNLLKKQISIKNCMLN
ncbi:GrpB family protein [Gillisia limnaea]|uniref:GrpB family protein n=1 Tax=Gillisia limnaea TaxID=195907 RepID=UPI0012E9CDC9